MTIAQDIIAGKLPDIEGVFAAGETLDDIDEYGFTPLIQSAIVGNHDAATLLLSQGVSIDKADVTGRTALHWAVDNADEEMVKQLLAKRANANAYNRGGQSVLVFPLLREQWRIKQLLYRANASLPFARDFIKFKLIGHRYELQGDIDLLTADNDFIELHYEGFILEFSLAVVYHSLQRFRNHYVARSLRRHFDHLAYVLDGFDMASQLLRLQAIRLSPQSFNQRLQPLLGKPLWILPVAYEGHAIAFVRFGEFLAKIDRGENSQREGTVNIYRVGRAPQDAIRFLKQLVFQKQTKQYIHHQLNFDLDLQRTYVLPIAPQLVGSCSWANIEAVIPTALFMIELQYSQSSAELKPILSDIMSFYYQWQAWDKDRALEDCLSDFSALTKPRQASRASLLAAVLFQTCDYHIEKHRQRADKILDILLSGEFHYVLESYINAYCTRRFTKGGNNLLKFLEERGYDPGIGLQSVASRIERQQSQT